MAEESIKPKEDHPMTIKSRENSRLLNIELTKAIAERNTIELLEFEKFLPLFSRDSNIDASEDPAIASLGIDYKERFDLYSPINVVDGESLLLVLPPMYTRVNQLSDGTDQASKVVQIFSNMIQHDNPLKSDKERALELIIAALNKAQDHERIAKDGEDMATILTNLHGNTPGAGVDGVVSDSSNNELRAGLTDWE
jgi:hypothetical protein